MVNPQRGRGGRGRGRGRGRWHHHNKRKREDRDQNTAEDDDQGHRDSPRAHRDDREPQRPHHRDSAGPPAHGRGRGGSQRNHDGNRRWDSRGRGRGGDRGGGRWGSLGDSLSPRRSRSYSSDSYRSSSSSYRSRSGSSDRGSRRSQSPQRPLNPDERRAPDGSSRRVENEERRHVGVVLGFPEDSDVANVRVWNPASRSVWNATIRAADNPGIQVMRSSTIEFWSKAAKGSAITNAHQIGQLLCSGILTTFDGKPGHINRIRGPNGKKIDHIWKCHLFLDSDFNSEFDVGGMKDGDQLNFIPIRSLEKAKWEALVLSVTESVAENAAGPSPVVHPLQPLQPKETCQQPSPVMVPVALPSIAEQHPQAPPVAAPPTAAPLIEVQQQLQQWRGVVHRVDQQHAVVRCNVVGRDMVRDATITLADHPSLASQIERGTTLEFFANVNETSPTTQSDLRIVAGDSPAKSHFIRDGWKVSRDYAHNHLDGVVGTVMKAQNPDIVPVRGMVVTFVRIPGLGRSSKPELLVLKGVEKTPTAENPRQHVDLPAVAHPAADSTPPPVTQMHQWRGVVHGVDQYHALVRCEVVGKDLLRDATITLADHPSLGSAIERGTTLEFFADANDAPLTVQRDVRVIEGNPPRTGSLLGPSWVKEAMPDAHCYVNFGGDDRRNNGIIYRRRNLNFEPQRGLVATCVPTPHRGNNVEYLVIKSEMPQDKQQVDTPRPEVRKPLPTHSFRGLIAQVNSDGHAVVRAERQGTGAYGFELQVPLSDLGSVPLQRGSVFSFTSSEILPRRLENENVKSMPPNLQHGVIKQPWHTTEQGWKRSRVVLDKSGGDELQVYGKHNAAFVEEAVRGASVTLVTFLSNKGHPEGLILRVTPPSKEVAQQQDTRAGGGRSRYSNFAQELESRLKARDDEANDARVAAIHRSRFGIDEPAGADLLEGLDNREHTKAVAGTPWEEIANNEREIVVLKDTFHTAQNGDAVEALRCLALRGRAHGTAPHVTLGDAGGNVEHPLDLPWLERPDRRTWMDAADGTFEDVFEVPSDVTVSLADFTAHFETGKFPWQKTSA